MGKSFDDAELAAKFVVGREVVLALVHFLFGISTFFITEGGILCDVPMATFSLSTKFSCDVFVDVFVLSLPSYILLFFFFF